MLAFHRQIQGAASCLRWPLLSVFLACGLYMLPGAASCLQYDRVCITDGQVWRLITSHWTHWSGEHLLWDLSVFAILMAWSLSIDSRRTGTVLALSSLLIPLGIYWMQPELVYYRGLSGLDSALFVFLAMKLVSRLKRQGDWAGMLSIIMLCIGLCLKILYEAATGQALCVTHMAPGVTVVPLAHIIGAGIGFACGLRIADKIFARPTTA